MKQIPGNAGLGTLLRHLVELLDGGVEAVYREQGLNCRSRFTPIIRHLEHVGPSSIRQIADASGLTHSAVSQTVSQMLAQGLVASTTGKDARERIISFTPEGEALLPRLHVIWKSIWAASDDLSKDVGSSLNDVLAQAVAAVTERPFRDRILKNVEAEDSRLAARARQRKSQPRSRQSAGLPVPGV